jgi:hypothetical protein
MARRDEYEADLAGDIVQTVRAKQTSFDASNSQHYLRPSRQHNRRQRAQWVGQHSKSLQRPLKGLRNRS